MKRGGGERAALNQRVREGEIETNSYLVFLNHNSKQRERAYGL
jgi:hypothetical protein